MFRIGDQLSAPFQNLDDAPVEGVEKLGRFQACSPPGAMKDRDTRAESSGSIGFPKYLCCAYFPQVCR